MSVVPSKSKRKTKGSTTINNPIETSTTKNNGRTLHHQH
jgi:hypothetical protein